MKSSKWYFNGILMDKRKEAQLEILYKVAPFIHQIKDCLEQTNYGLAHDKVLELLISLDHGNLLEEKK